MAGEKNNATSSWSGYNHQGQVGIFLALKELSELIQNDEDFGGYSVQFEKEDGEDIDIVKGIEVISRHQVKAKKNKKNLNDYKDVLTGFKKDGVDENSRYLHTICDVVGFDLSEEEFKELPYKPKFIPNVNNVKLYEYPNGNKYCELSNTSESKIDSFCKDEIKNLLRELSHKLGDDQEHIKETLFELKELLCTKIRVAHESGGGANPIISFTEIYEVVTSTQKREKQAICRAKRLFEIYWNENTDDNVNLDLLNEILNLSQEQFECFIIDLHPQKNIKSLKEEQLIDSLLDEDIFEEIFYKFYKEINQSFFDIPELRYDSTRASYRLSLINKNACESGEVGKLVQKIRNNKQFLKASFDVDYLVNGRINSPFFEYKQLETGLNSSYCKTPSGRDNLFSNHIEFIGIAKAVEKLREEKHE